MTEFIIAIILITMCSIFDKCRGSKELTIISNFAEAMLMGACLALLATIYSDYGLSETAAITLGFALLFAVCEWPGWGAPLGALLYDTEMGKTGLERWQVGILKTNPVLALIARGGIWALPALLMSCWYPEFIYIFVAMPVAMPVAVVVARELGGKYKHKNTWQLQELIRGGLCATLTYMMALGATL
jgi:hypothetical protein